MNQAITIVGAGGKMGGRLTDNLRKLPYGLTLCERSEAGAKRIQEKGLAVTPAGEAVPLSDFVILAVPDARMASVTREIVPLMKKGAIAILLDPAAAYNGEVHLRPDCAFVVTHPCHPPLFGQQDSPEARRDFFGGILARQDIVVALFKGTDADYAAAEKVCREMFAPVVRAHRVTVEQMAILEPAMSEVVGAAAATLIKQAMDQAIRLGVPPDAARSFMLGHTQIPLAIVFGEIGSPFSDAAKIAVKIGFEKVIRPDWQEVFTPGVIRSTIHRMLHPEEET
ncbi:MAG TPA: phosphogluconate dehydrogenase C-terminal domain-containing protein [Spirochaetia bacterium]|nr:phosphogluconate dehydrogenase C-terminal domain-containing protein [Spirochaetia bacterium]